MSAPHTVEFRSSASPFDAHKHVCTISAQKTGSGVWLHTRRYSNRATAQVAAEVSVLLDDAAAAELGAFVVAHSGGDTPEMMPVNTHLGVVACLLQRMTARQIIDAAQREEITMQQAVFGLRNQADDPEARAWMSAYRLTQRNNEAQ